MVAFAANQQKNGLQLTNLLIFLASGVTKRVSTYLSYIRLSSSRRTANSAVRALGKEAEKKLRANFSLEHSPEISPMICFDNLDFQEKVHMKIIGNSNHMFHGIWGYVHSIPPGL